MRFKELEQSLAHVSERRQVLALDDDQLGTELPRLGDEHELSNALGSGIIITGCKDVLLPDA